MPEAYDVTIVTVRPGTHPQALAVLGKSLADDRNLLACWYSDIGAVNQILIIRKAADGAATLDARYAALSAANPFGIGEYTVAMAMDTYVSFDFIPPLQPGEFGPFTKCAVMCSSQPAWRRPSRRGANRCRAA